MRVLMVTRTFLPEHRGGMENHAYQLAQVLRARGHTVVLLHCDFSSDRPEYDLSDLEWDGLRIFRLVRNYTNSMLNPFPFFDRQVELAFERVLDRASPDIVHLHHLADLSCSLPAAARRHGLPSVLTLHDFWPMCFMSHLRMPDGTLCSGPDGGLRCVECLWQQWRASFSPVNVRVRVRELGAVRALARAPRFAADWLAARMNLGGAAVGSLVLRSQMQALPVRDAALRSVVAAADLVISPSRFLADRFVEWGVPAARCRVLRNSVPRSLSLLRAASRPPGERVAFGFVGSLYPPKGVHLLIDAFRHVEPGSAELHIWGQPPTADAQAYASRLHEQAAGLPHLVFEGGFPPDRLPTVLSGIDVLVLPSTWYENNPLVILEAQAAGLPVLAGDAGGMAELVRHEVDGMLFALGDPRDLAAKMQLMTDRSRLARLRAGIVPPWTHEELGAEVERIYASLLSQARPSTAA